MKKIYLLITTNLLVSMTSFAQCEQLPQNTGNTGCVTFVYKGAETTLTTVKGADGNIWLQQNLGSSNVAANSTDVNSFGDLFQWGRWDDGHQDRFSTTSTSPTPNNPLGVIAGNSNFLTAPNWWSGFQLTDKWEATNPENATEVNGCDPCKAIGNDWKLPSQEEWAAIVTAENINSPMSAFDSNLKLSVGGNRDATGTFNFTGVRGYYWSNTTSSTGAKYLYYSSAITNISAGGPRGQGMSVRCLRLATTLALNPNVKSKFSIYPNPTNGIFFIETEGIINDVTIFDIVGKQILKSNNKEINLSNFEKGIYFVQVSIDNNIVSTQKIIKR